MRKLILLLILLLILIFPIIVNAAQVCGDGKCSGQETCSTCPGDCDVCPTTPTTTPPTGGGAGVQKIIGIYPRFPLDEQTIKNGEHNFEVKITYGGSPSSSAKVILESELFESTELKYISGINGIYKGNVTIKNKPKGKYRVLYKVEDKEDEEGEILINLDPEIRIYTELQSNYSKGEKIIFEGIIKDYNKDPQPNVEVKIKGISQSGQLFEKTTSTNSNGQFSAEYLVNYADPKGILNITIEAEDEYDNYGINTFSTEIKQSGVENYIVNFMSPLTESEFKRGESIPITIQIKEKNELIENVNVFFYNPRDEKVKLNEVEKGIYSTSYIVDSKDPIGNVLIKIEALKEVKEGIVKVGGDSLPIKISPTEITFETLSPSSDIAYTNSRLKIETKLSYPNGNPVEGAKINAELSNGKIIELLEGKRGKYSGEYVVKLEDRGLLNLKISAEDINENVGSTDITLFIRKRSFIGNILAFIQDIIKQYLWAILAFLIAAALIYRPNFEISWIKRKIQKSIEEQKNLKAMLMETEKKYYKEGIITKKEFRDIMEKYEERLAKANEDEKIYKKELIKKLERIKKKNRS